MFSPLVGYWPLADVVDVILALKRRYIDGYIHFGNGSWRRRCGSVFFHQGYEKGEGEESPARSGKTS